MLTSSAAHSAATARASVCGVVVLALGDDAVDGPARGEVDRADLLPVGHLLGVLGVAVDDDAGSFGRERCEPRVLGRQDAPRGEQRKGTTAAALSQQHGEGGHAHPRHGRDAPCDLTGHGTLFGGHGQLGSGRVDHGDERQSQLFGEVHGTPGFSQGGRPHGPSGPLSRAVLTDEHAGLPVEAGEGDDDRLVAFALVGATQAQGVAGAVPQEVAHACSVGPAREGDGLPRRTRGQGGRVPPRAGPAARAGPAGPAATGRPARAAARRRPRRRSRPWRQGSRPAAPRPGTVLRSAPRRPSGRGSPRVRLVRRR